MTAKFLDEGMRKYLYTMARKNHWRVAQWIDLDDLTQDGFMCYAKCVHKYPDVVDQKHMMKLVMVTFVNHISTLAGKHTASIERKLARSEFTRGADSERAADDSEAWDLLPEAESATILTELEHAPGYIRDLILLLAKDSGEALGMMLNRRGKLTKVRENSNEHFCRLLGLNPKDHDIASRVRAYFAN